MTNIILTSGLDIKGSLHKIFKTPLSNYQNDLENKLLKLIF